MKIHLSVTLPDELYGEFMQYIRDYEAPRSDKVHLDMFSSDTEMTAEQVIKILSKVKPEIPWIRNIPDDKA